MTRQSWYFLKCCKKLDEPDFNYTTKDNCIRNVHKVHGGIEIKKYTNEIDSIIDYLLENGFLKRTHFGYALTQKGLHPNQMAWEDIKSFLVKSIAVPIIVSAITAFITLCIGSL